MIQAANNELNVEAWFTKADEDELSARAILKDEAGAPSTACFLSQQIAEKYLKALLIFYSQSFPKIHDLKRLATLLEPFVSDIFSLEEEFNVLNKYYPTTRYPGDFPEGFSWQDAEEALQASIRIKEFVLARVGRAEQSPSEGG